MTYLPKLCKPTLKKCHMSVLNTIGNSKKTWYCLLRQTDDSIDKGIYAVCEWCGLCSALVCQGTGGRGGSTSTLTLHRHFTSSISSPLARSIPMLLASRLHNCIFLRALHVRGAQQSTAVLQCHGASVPQCEKTFLTLRDISMTGGQLSERCQLSSLQMMGPATTGSNARCDSAQLRGICLGTGCTLMMTKVGAELS